jgi:hypothetical protein
LKKILIKSIAALLKFDGEAFTVLNELSDPGFVHFIVFPLRPLGLLILSLLCVFLFFRLNARQQSSATIIIPGKNN